jgi:anti-sigma B factor antagonist
MSPEPSPLSERGFRMDVRRSEASPCAIVSCHGRLTSEHAPHLRNKVRTLLSDEKRIVLDFQGVSFMDSSGLGTLVTLYVSCRSRGCRLELINLSAALRTLLGMTNLLSLFEHAGRYGGKMP